jgi:hypothetical protein
MSFIMVEEGGSCPLAEEWMHVVLFPIWYMFGTTEKVVLSSKWNVFPWWIGPHFCVGRTAKAIRL